MKLKLMGMLLATVVALTAIWAEVKLRRYELMPGTASVLDHWQGRFCGTDDCEYLGGDWQVVSTRTATPAEIAAAKAGLAATAPAPTGR